MPLKGWATASSSLRVLGRRRLLLGLCLLMLACGIAFAVAAPTATHTASPHRLAHVSSVNVTSPSVVPAAPVPPPLAPTLRRKSATARSSCGSGCTAQEVVARPSRAVAAPAVTRTDAGASSNQSSASTSGSGVPSGETSGTGQIGSAGGGSGSSGSGSSGLGSADGTGTVGRGGSGQRVRWIWRRWRRIRQRHRRIWQRQRRKRQRREWLERWIGITRRPSMGA